MAGHRKKRRKGMAYLLIAYPKCSTCQKAKNWLQHQGIPFEERHIVEENPTVEELRQWAQTVPLKKFFNTSGILYRAQGLKDRLPHMTEEEQLALLASNGMLVKRPLVVGQGQVLVGFKPTEWEAHLKQ